MHTSHIAAPANRLTITDEEVIGRIRAGEDALFEILMRRHNRRVYRVARAILGSDTEAEDVMQEAYVRAYTHLDQFESRAKFSTWLTRIAVHEALARTRRSERFESLDEVDSEIELGPGVVSTARSPEEQLFGRQLQDLLEAAIDALPPAYRLVFVMREIEELSTSETAEALEVTEEVIKTRLHRARGMLQRDLYSRVGSTAPSVFEFHLSRCDRVVHAVMERIHDRPAHIILR